MKKLMTLKLGLLLALGCVSVSFAQDTSKPKKSKKAAKGPQEVEERHREIILS